MKVLHSLSCYLRISENWIYPQITRPRGVTPGILCATLDNLDLFPLEGAPRFRDPPPWSTGLGVPRVVNSVAFRMGHPCLVAGAAAKRWGPDLIHAHFGMRGWEMVPVSRRLGARLVTSFYGVDAWQLPQSSALWRGRYPELFAEGAAFIAEGPAMAARLAEIGCPRERIHVVRLGVDVTALPWRERKFGPTASVVMMARFIEKKGLCDGLRACAEAIRMGANLEAVIIGGPGKGDAAGEEIEAELHKIGRTEELEGRVTFPGFLKPAAAREVLMQADIFLSPSKHAADGDAEGGSPLALTEAMALGMLCIGTRHCDIPEVIRDGETGLLAESGDVPALAGLLARAVADPDASRALAARGRRHIETEFSTERQGLDLEKIYRRLVPAAGAC